MNASSVDRPLGGAQRLHPGDAGQGQADHRELADALGRTDQSGHLHLRQVLLQVVLDGANDQLVVL
jgi:hypothetical protein